MEELLFSNGNSQKVPAEKRNSRKRTVNGKCATRHQEGGGGGGGGNNLHALYMYGKDGAKIDKKYIDIYMNNSRENQCREKEQKTGEGEIMYLTSFQSCAFMCE